MDYRQFRAFVAVFEERNITAAAQRLHLSQPALSGSIRLLEEALGTALFVRKARGVEVTDDARALYPQLRRMVAEADGLAQRFRKRDERERLTIGVEEDVARSTVQHLAATARACVPDLQLHLLAQCEGDARLASEELRCEDELFLPLLSERYVLALPAPSLVPGNVTDTAQDAAMDWIVCPTHASHQRLLPLYGSRGDSPAALAGNFSLALDLVAAGVGSAIVPESLAQEVPGVQTQPLEVELKRRIGLCYNVQALGNGALARLRDGVLGTGAKPSF
ncbi:LysR family transcriptional regulator [Comamonas piscis]|uniref:LysR family transcriptional regulator n=1 Tax=Comamonas piscis TaxID=1562974 RepID=A0A7G5ED11_9BURK|nr:LysR family transcriptional regulator [Comamonas piscis]QMV71886.1 LysR family transcriptional regulator [Comamonas piscis]WSO34622.1 LysR family transcriptional regulator [Comamonas piscis]